MALIPKRGWAKKEKEEGGCFGLSACALSRLASENIIDDMCMCSAQYSMLLSIRQIDNI